VAALVAAPVNLDAVHAALAPAARTALGSLRWEAEVDSSNSVLLREAATLPDRAALLVDAQHAGRGRRGRPWQSPAGANLYLSLFARLQRPLAALGGLSLALGIGCAEELRAAGVGAAGLKWPNDLLVDGRKLGGLLVELAGERDGRAAAVIGLGLNLAMPATAAEAIEQPWTDLVTLGVAGDRGYWAARMLDALLAAVDEFESAGFAPFTARWDAVDALAGRPLAVHAADGVLHGIGAGIDADGALRLRMAAGERRFHSADVSLRAR
jgi:BirA family transcriptional regulator, biotin operon repressor / biotin---[acetyl-CoA-carboxylase] ligase